MLEWRHADGNPVRSAQDGPGPDPGGQIAHPHPLTWPEREKQRVIARFQRWAEAQTVPLPSPALPPVDPESFRHFVERVNQETLFVPLGGVRLGQARLSRLAQANTKTRVLTFSRFAVAGMPERALRYLVLHELAHLLVPNHSAPFWNLVARHEPDFRQQRKIAQAHFRRNTQ